MRLADFAGGLVAGVKWPGILKDKEAQQTIRKWVDRGELVCPNEPDDQVDVVASLLYTRDTVGQAVHDPAVKPVEKRQQRQPAAKAVVGAGWIAVRQEWTDGVVLEVGQRVQQVDANCKVDSAARECARRIERETGAKPLVCFIQNEFRVIEQRWLTDVKPG